MLRLVIPLIAASALLAPPASAADQQKQSAADQQKQSAADQQKQTKAPTQTHWVKDKRGCKFANPDPKPGESVSWSGACVDGLMEGKGVLQFFSQGDKPEAHYEGTLTKGRLTGRGILRTPDGATYDGDWVDGKQDGYGVYTAADGKSKYEGGWTAGQPDGAGTYHNAKGEIVHGVWENGKLVQKYEK